MMLKKPVKTNRLACLAFALLLFSNQGFSCNYAILRLEGDALYTKIWAKRTIQEEDIRDSLTFLEDDDAIPVEYKNEAEFQKLTEMANKDMTQDPWKIKKAYLGFVETCESVYGSSKTTNMKASTHILMKYVRDRVLQANTELVELEESIRAKDAERQQSSAPQPIEHNNILILEDQDRAAALERKRKQPGDDRAHHSTRNIGKVTS